MRWPFGSRRSRRVYHKAASAAGQSVTESVPPPSAQPHELVGVIGVGITVTVAELGLTLLSVERYEEGLIALFRVLRSRGRLEREFPHPHLDLVITPAIGEPYRVWEMGGSGGGRDMTEVEYRMNYAITPAPAEGTAEIAIEVREIAWEKWTGHGREVTSKTPGPWRFTVTL